MSSKQTFLRFTNIIAELRRSEGPESEAPYQKKLEKNIKKKTHRNYETHVFFFFFFIVSMTSGIVKHLNDVYHTGWNAIRP